MYEISRKILFSPDGDGDGGGDGGGNVDGGVPGNSDGNSPAIIDANWRASLPEDMRDNPTLAKYGSIESLAKGHISSQQALGNNVAIPSKDADHTEFWNKAGRPEKAEGYELPEIEGVESLGLPETASADYQAKAHELGLTQRQMAGLWQYHAEQGMNSMNEFSQRQTSESEAGMQQLQKDWGGAYDEKLSQARAAVEEFGGDDMKTLLNDTGFGDNPVFLRAFADIGKAMANDKLYGRGDEVNKFSTSPEDARGLIQAKKLDATFMNAYLNADNIGHQAAVAEMTRLQQIANPEE